MPKTKLSAVHERKQIEGYLRAHNIPFTRPNEHQIKIGDVNFYPSTGTILRDGRPEKEKERGARALIAIISGDNELDPEPL